MSASIGNKIKTFRTQKKITQSQLASVLGISSSTVGMYEQDRREPDLRTLILLCDYFGVSADELLGISKPAVILQPRNDTTVLSERELYLLRAYREQPDLQLLVNDLLGFNTTSFIPVFEAAHSEDNHPPRTSCLPKEKWEKLSNAPETDDPLL